MRDLTQSYDKSPYTYRKFKNQMATQKRLKNLDKATIADRLRTAGETAAIQLVWFNQFIGTEPSHQPQRLC